MPGSGRMLAAPLAAAVLAIGAVAARPGEVAAECTYIPPMPKISMAVPSATELFVGDVIANPVANSSASRAIFTVRVTEVLRGGMKVGEERTFRYLEPNWPWSNYPGGQPYASCAVISAAPGERVALALGARWPGGLLHDGDISWYQPPTTFNTIALISPADRDPFSGGRQVFSIERLREMAAAFPPDTATLGPAILRPARTTDLSTLAIAIASSICALSVWRRTRCRPIGSDARYPLRTSRRRGAKWRPTSSTRPPSPTPGS